MNTAPASNGQRRKGKLSDFGTQLRAKQKLKGYYGNITEKQFRRYYAEATRQRGDFRREPDRPARAPSRCRGLSREIRADPPFAARQFVNHGHITVKGRRTQHPELPRESPVT